MLKLILAELKYLKDGQLKLEEGQKELQSGQKDIKKDIKQLQNDVASIKKVTDELYKDHLTVEKKVELLERKAL